MKALYFSRLDTLRFVAFFLVFWQHAFANAFAEIDGIDGDLIKAFTMTGGYGVQIFFVLSGFLITLLLLKEYDQNGKISVGNFYMRRALRIWPLYYLVMITGMYILPAITETAQFCGSPSLSLLFLNNFDVHPECTTSIGMAWSVAIEEQFYLFWPLIFMLLVKYPKVLFLGSLTLFSGSLAFNLVYPTESYFHTFGNIIYLMAGCMGAIVFVRNSAWIKTDKILNSTGLILAVITILLFVALRLPYKVILFPMLFLYIVVFLVYRDEQSERITVFSKLGKYTYGMYMYHPTLILLTKVVFDKMGLGYKENMLIHIVMAVGILVLTIIVSMLSYRFIEKPILSFKSRFASIKTRI